MEPGASGSCKKLEADSGEQTMTSYMRGRRGGEWRQMVKTSKAWAAGSPFSLVF